MITFLLPSALHAMYPGAWLSGKELPKVDFVYIETTPLFSRCRSSSFRWPIKDEIFEKVW